jgi:hypothetical protein
MSIPNRQIGWSNESNLLWQIAKQIERLTGITANITPGGGGGAEVVTKAQVDTLIGSNSLVPGTIYIISGVDVPLYGGTTVILKAATTNKLELAGHGLFYNPKYINSQATPNNGYGVWQSTNTYSIGDDAIWGGKHWTNKTGSVGSSVNRYTLDATNWDVVSFDDVNYNVAIDVIHYDYEHDMIIRRKDKFDNDVDASFPVIEEFNTGLGFGNAIKDFQWGNGNEDFNTIDYYYLGVQSNYVKDSYLECLNFIGYYLHDNSLTEKSYIRNNVFTTTALMAKNKLSNNSNISSNNLGSYSRMMVNSLSNASSMSNNTLLSDTKMEYNTLIGSSMSSNSLSSSAFIKYNSVSNSSSISNNVLGTIAQISYNTVGGSGQILNNTLGANATIYYNNINSSYINSNSTSGSSTAGINFNSLSGSSYIQSNALAGSVISFNTLTNNTTLNFSSSGSLSSKTISKITASGVSATSNISAATIIFASTYAKQLFTNSAGTARLGYYNASDVFTVVNVNA